VVVWAYHQRSDWVYVRGEGPDQRFAEVLAVELPIAILLKFRVRMPITEL
jgi:hypothetical protein